MINLVSLFSYPAFIGGDLSSFFTTYQDVILYTIPFLLIFSIVYGILIKAKIFGDNKAVATIIGIAVSFLALWQGTVINFFSVIFPNLGIAISVLLVILILLGLFMSFQDSNYGTIILWFTGAVLAIIVILTSLSDYAWWGSYWWQEYGGLIVLLILVAVVVGVVVGTSGKKDKSKYRWLVPDEKP